MNEILEAKQIVHSSVTGTKANGEGAGTPCEDAPAIVSKRPRAAVKCGACLPAINSIAGLSILSLAQA
jgi:hypothetical protein